MTGEHAAAANTAVALSSTTTDFRSIKMISMHEALARERLYESQRSARMSRLARELAATRRWRRLERLARTVHERHARSVAFAATAVRWE